ncbi:MAG: hypothetical protein KDK41_11950 [Leptospiraceae bacterium]|nr:hypothetical protein [Leptospiraceae bacterium]
MATGDVKTFHESGGVAASAYPADRVHAKVGQAESGNHNQIYLIGNAAQAKDVFGRGPLVDALIQHFEEFNVDRGEQVVPVLAIRPENDDAGSVNIVEGDGNTGAVATPTTSGAPTATRKVVLVVTKAGASGTAEYKRSLDGGITFESPLVFPASASPLSLGSGVTATFTDDATPADTFDVGDTFTFELTGPTPSTESILAALEFLKQEYRAYFIQVLHKADLAFAVALNALAAEMATDFHNPVRMIVEALAKTGDETVAEYYARLMSEYEPFFSDRVMIVAWEGYYIAGGIEAAGGIAAVEALNVAGEWRNAATFLAARAAASAVNESTAWVEKNRSRTFSKIRYWEEGYQDYYDSLDDMRLVVGKLYDNYQGIFIASDKIKSHPDSDFIELPEGRRADKMHRIVRMTTLPFLHADAEVNSSSGGIAAVEAAVNAAVSKQMMQAGAREISSAKVTLDPDKTYSQDQILKARIQMGIKGRTKSIEWTTSFAILK